ncbi:MAG: hypothetical protein HUU26_00415 [Gemmatimonadaceae bacterium]|nr:hypothetical protein [Gemmatimonadaceae bacterium]
MATTALRYLPDEEDRNEFRVGSQRFKLTTRRLFSDGESKRLLIIPGGRVLSVAMLEDVDLAFLGRTHVLPTWVGLLGAVAAVAALAAQSGIGFVLSAALVAAWYFLGATVLEFRVDGSSLGTVSVVSAGGLDQELVAARAFVEAFFEAKAHSRHVA